VNAGSDTRCDVNKVSVTSALPYSCSHSVKSTVRWHRCTVIPYVVRSTIGLLSDSYASCCCFRGELTTCACCVTCVTVRGDTVGSRARLRAAGRGDRRHGAATQAGARHPDVDGEGSSKTAEYSWWSRHAQSIASTRET